MEVDLWATEPRMMVNGMYVCYVEVRPIRMSERDKVLHRVPVYFNPDDTLPLALTRSYYDMREAIRTKMQAGLDAAIAAYMSTTRGLTA